MVQPGACGRQEKLFNIHASQQALGEGKNSLLFMHGVAGCDRTSAPFGKGKTAAYKRLISNAWLALTTAVFTNAEATKANECCAGEKFLLAL